MIEVTPLRKAAMENAAYLMYVKPTIFEEAVREKPAPYVEMWQRKELVRLGRQYEDMKLANHQLNVCLTLIGRLENLKQPTAKHLEQKQQAWGEAEEWQGIVDHFWSKHPDSFLGDPKMEQALRAYKQFVKKQQIELQMKALGI